MVKRLRRQRSLLATALSDVSKELMRLKRERVSTEKKLGLAKGTLQEVQGKEASLRAKLNKLINRETKLTHRRNETSQKLDKLKDKLEKVTKLKDELRNV